MQQLSERLLNQYVPKARRVLIAVALKRELVPYAEIMNGLGGRGYVGQVLDELNRREDAVGHPMISAIVVNADTRTPSGGFFALARRLGRSGDDRTLWERERDRIWAFDWLN